MKVLKWSIHGGAKISCDRIYEIPRWIVNRVISETLDCIVLTEFVISRRWDYFQEEFVKHRLGYCLQGWKIYNEI